MPLDHYVPQVHLKGWLSATSGGLLNAMRKSDLKTFTPGTKAVCAIQDGSTNQYLADDRMIEGFLEEFEPRYNEAVSNLSGGRVDHESVRTIAGLVSCISSCSPTSMRLHAPFLRQLLTSTAKILDRKGIIPRLNGVGIQEMLEDGAADIRIDGKYPQAFSIQNIEKTTAIFGKCEWEIIHNEFDESPFFTSDYPIGLEPSSRFTNINNKIIPLTPKVAVRIKPDPEVKNRPTPVEVKFRMYAATREQVRNINRIIVQSAEDLIFYRDAHEWVPMFIQRNRHFRIESVVFKGALKKGDAVLSSQRIVPFVQGSSHKEERPESDNWFEFGVAQDA